MMKKTTRKYIWVLVTNALLLVAIGAMWQYRLHTQKEPGAQYLPNAAYMADLSGQAHLGDLKGQWVLLNLWAAWCPACITEMPSLDQLSKDYKSKGLQVVAISVDEAKSANEIAAHVKKFKFGPLARNWDHKGEIFAALNPQGLPMTYLADPSGKIVHVFAGGYDWSAPEAREVIDQSLEVSSGTTVNRSPTKP